MGDSGKIQLGKILLKRKLVSSNELDKLLHEQNSDREHSERLASKVLEKGITDEIKLLKALSEQAGVPAVNLEQIEILLENLDIVPEEIAKQHLILPMVVKENSVNLAMANPDDQRVIDEIEFVSGKRVFPHVCLHAQVVSFLENCYRAKEEGKTVFRGSLVGKHTDSSMQSQSSGQVSPSVVPDKLELADGELSFDIEFGVDDGPDSKIGSESQSMVESLPASDPTLDERKKILVVDDEDDIRLLISRLLVEKGYKVVTAGRGLEAIQKVQTENPDMIILDAMLPEVHGFDICKKIKGSKKYGHIPVIMISAIYRGWRYAQDLKDSYGVDDFIEKPFKLQEFIEKVEKHLLAHEDDQIENSEDLSGQAEKILADSVNAYHAGDIDNAISLLKSGIEIDPLAFKLHYNLALLLGRKSLNYQAIRELENALELAPQYFPALKNLALLYQKAGFKFKAIETWERAMHYCPDEETRDSIKRHLMSLL